MEKMVPGGHLDVGPLSVLSQGALEISSVAGQPPSLVRNHFSSPRVVARPCKHDEGCRPSPQRPQYTDASYKGYGAHLEQVSTKGLCPDREKGLHRNIIKLKAVFLPLKKDQCQI